MFTRVIVGGFCIVVSSLGSGCVKAGNPGPQSSTDAFRPKRDYSLAPKGITCTISTHAPDDKGTAGNRLTFDVGTLSTYGEMPMNLQDTQMVAYRGGVQFKESSLSLEITRLGKVNADGSTKGNGKVLGTRKVDIKEGEAMPVTLEVKSTLRGTKETIVKLDCKPVKLQALGE